ncbi:hypothetical protein S83_004991 [Arachis hypogaea]
MDSFSENPENSILVFVADGRFHLEAIMIANPGIKVLVLNPFEAEITLGVIPGWWEKKKNVLAAKVEKGCEDGGSNCGGEYPMDYYSQDGGEWNSSYVKKSSRPVRRISVSLVATNAISQQS